MTPEFRASIRRAMLRYEEQGYTVRQRTPSELKAYDKQLNDEDNKKLEQVPFERRLQQVWAVRALAQKQGIRIVDACDVIGISFDNYRSVLAAHKRGQTHR